MQLHYHGVYVTFAKLAHINVLRLINNKGWLRLLKLYFILEIDFCEMNIEIQETKMCYIAAA